MLNSELYTKPSCLGQESNNPLNRVIKLKKKKNQCGQMPEGQRPQRRIESP